MKFASGHQANLAAESIAAVAGGLTACNLNSDSAQLNFNGTSYNALPRVLAASNLPSRADGNDTLLIVNRIGGNLGTGAATLGTLFGLLYDDAEKTYSFSLPAATCQSRGSLTNDRPRVVPRFGNPLRTRVSFRTRRPMAWPPLIVATSRLESVDRLSVP